MKIFVGGRRAGKTTQLIQYAAAEDLYIVCRNQEHVDDIVRRAQQLNIQIRCPITVAELPLLTDDAEGGHRRGID